MSDLDLKQIETTLHDELFVILNSSQIGYNELRKPQFQTLIEKQFNILYFIESKNSKKKKHPSSQLVERYNALLNKNFKIDETIAFSDLHEMYDEVKYLEVYYKNIVKVDLAQYTKDNIENIRNASKQKFQPQQAQQAGAAPQQPNTEKITTDQTKVVNANQAQPNQQMPPPMGAFGNQGSPWGGGRGGMGMGGMGMGGMPYGQNPYANMDPRQNPYIVGPASQRLQQEIKSGQIFAYKSKPKIIPLMKMLAAILIALLAITTLTTSIFMFLANNIAVWGQYRLTSGGTLLEGWVPMSTIWTGVMYVIVSLLLLFMAFSFIKPMLKLKGKKPNPNEQYYFSMQTLIMFFIVFVMCLMMGMPVYTNTFIDVAGTVPAPAYDTWDITNTMLVGKDGWFWGMITTSIIAGLTLIPVIVGSIYNPKKDNEKLNMIFEQYVDELAKAQGPRQF